jgi:tRNA wybutosine-synthesizing protein 3
MISFQRRKEDILKKSDKSSKKSWDRRISDLCNKINSRKEYYTTSSCSGRIVLIKSSSKKQPDLFLKVWHDKITFNELKKSLNKIKKDNRIEVNYKSEPAILHLSSENISAAQSILNKAKQSGWKNGGIISSQSRFIIELSNTERFEFPLIRKGELLVNDKFIKMIVKESNEKLKKTWEKIDRFEKALS